jgi:hypothetical protein
MRNCTAAADASSPRFEREGDEARGGGFTSTPPVFPLGA